MKVSFVYSERGGKLLIYKDFLYRVSVTQNEKSYWKCVRSNCKARAQLKNDVYDSASGFHSHEPEHKKIAKKLFSENLRKKVSEQTTATAPEIYRQVFQEMSATAKAPLPSYSSVKKSLYRFKDQEIGNKLKKRKPDPEMRKMRRMKLIDALETNITEFVNWISTEKGKSLESEGFLYNVNKRLEEKSYWFCAEKDCIARAVLDAKDEIILYYLGEHNHDPEKVAVEINTFLENLKKRARTESTAIPKIYGEEADKMSESLETFKVLPTFENVKDNLYRIRRLARELSKEDSNSKDSPLDDTQSSSTEEGPEDFRLVSIKNELIDETESTCTKRDDLDKGCASISESTSLIIPDPLYSESNDNTYRTSVVSIKKEQEEDESFNNNFGETLEQNSVEVVHISKEISSPVCSLQHMAQKLNPTDSSHLNVSESQGNYFSASHGSKSIAQQSQEILVDRINDDSSHPASTRFMPVREKSAIFASSSSPRDHCTTQDETHLYGNLITSKLRKYDPTTQSAIQSAIMEIFAMADRGYYDSPYDTPVPMQSMIRLHNPQLLTHQQNQRFIMQPSNLIRPSSTPPAYYSQPLMSPYGIQRPLIPSSSSSQTDDIATHVHDINCRSNSLSTQFHAQGHTRQSSSGSISSRSISNLDLRPAQREESNETQSLQTKLSHISSQPSHTTYPQISQPLIDAAVSQMKLINSFSQDSVLPTRSDSSLKISNAFPQSCENVTQFLETDAKPEATTSLPTIRKDYSTRRSSILLQNAKNVKEVVEADTSTESTISSSNGLEEDSTQNSSNSSHDLYSPSTNNETDSENYLSESTPEKTTTISKSFIASEFPQSSTRRPNNSSSPKSFCSFSGSFPPNTGARNINALPKSFTSLANTHSISTSDSSADDLDDDSSVNSD